MIHLFSIPTPQNSSVSPLRSLRFDHLHGPGYRIPSYTNNLVAGAAPILLVIIIGGYRNSLHEIHHGLLATISGGFVMPHTRQEV